MKKRETAAGRKYKLKKLLQVARSGVKAIHGEIIKKRTKRRARERRSREKF